MLSCSNSCLTNNMILCLSLSALSRPGLCHVTSARGDALIYPLIKMGTCEIRACLF